MTVMPLQGEQRFCVPAWRINPHTPVVQIMTTEEWYTIMWGLIDAEFRYSAIYFYAVIVFGTYFFWNIFINGVIAIFLRLNSEHLVGIHLGLRTPPPIRQPLLSDAVLPSI